MGTLAKAWLAMLLALSTKSAMARPDVGFPDTEVYLQATYDPQARNSLIFSLHGVIPDIVLPRQSYNLQMLRHAAKVFPFHSDELRHEIVYMLGNDGEEFGNSFDTAIPSFDFLVELIRLLQFTHADV